MSMNMRRSEAYLRDDNPSAKAALRVAQSVAIVGQMPIILVGNGLGCLIGSFALHDAYTTIECLPLVLGLWLLLLPVALSWWRLRGRIDKVTVSEKRIFRLIVYSGILGHSWAIFMLFYLPSTSIEVATFLIMGCAFLAACSAAVLYIIPMACVAYAGPILAAALYLAATSGSSFSITLTLLVALMAAGVGWMLHANWKNFNALCSVSNDKTRLLQDAAQQSAAKSEFLENISHEIKNPLSSVIGYANLLNQSASRFPAELQVYIKNVVHGGEALTVLLNDLLEMAKLDVNHIKLVSVPFQARELLRDTVSLVLLSSHAKKLPVNLEVASTVPDWLLADPFRLRQVVLNLLGNAIKFTAQGRVDIKAAWLPTAGPHSGILSIKVADTGAGIPHETHSLLFKRFSQLDSNGSNGLGLSGLSGGSGLGLAICRRLLHLMGGTIGLKPEAGYGTVFEIRVPMAVGTVPDIMPNEKIVTGPMHVARKKILIADDAPLNRELIRLILEPLGHDVVEAGSGRTVVTLCTKERFDLIFMDIEMPCLDGLMATSLIRSECPLNLQTPVIAVTGHVCADQLAEFKEAGMNDCLYKPLSSAALLSKFHTWTGTAPEEYGCDNPDSNANLYTGH